jgi:hypothetical protein
MSRKYTTKLIEMVDEGLINKDILIQAFCNYMSEDQIQDLMESENFIEADDNETE